MAPYDSLLLFWANFVSQKLLMAPSGFLWLLPLQYLFRSGGLHNDTSSGQKFRLLGFWKWYLMWWYGCVVVECCSGMIVGLFVGLVVWLCGRVMVWYWSHTKISKYSQDVFLVIACLVIFQSVLLNNLLPERNISSIIISMFCIWFIKLFFNNVMYDSYSY